MLSTDNDVDDAEAEEVQAAGNDRSNPLSSSDLDRKVYNQDKR